MPLTGAEEAFVRAFARATITVPRAFDADLVREQGLLLSDYTTLMNLSEAPDQRMTMGELATANALSMSGMTRVIQRLESQGFVRREKSSCDGRSWHAVLTKTGLKRLEAAWPTHLASVRRHLLDHLGELDLEKIATAIQHCGEHVCSPERDAGG